MRIAAWWDRFPERLEHELGELRAAGIDFDDPSFDSTRGVMIIVLRHEVAGERRRFEVVFPAFYPFTRFEVRSVDEMLPRHMNPFGGNLCLIGRDTSNWNVDDTLADFILNRLPQVFVAAAGTDEDEAAELEEHQGEPFSAYYTYAPSSMVLVDGGWRIPGSVERGEMVVRWISRPDGDLPARGVVLRVIDGHGGDVAVADERILRVTPQGRDERIPWVRLPEPPATNDPRAVRRFAVERLPAGQRRHSVLAVLFPEEVGWRETGDGWLVVVQRAARNRSRVPGAVELVRVGRAGPDDLAQRSPEAKSLRSRTAAIFGLGALGSPSAVTLARTGVGDLRLVDHDVVEPGTVVRWELGLQAAGHPKAPLLAHHIRTNWPYTTAQPFVWQVGNPLNPDARELEWMAEILDGADLIYDATAELGIQYLLSTLAAEHEIPYVAVSSTDGAHGGLILRIHPERTEACWVCHRHHLETGSLPSPPRDPNGRLQPIGCAEPTFTGSALDLQNVANQAVRAAIHTMLASDDGRDWWDLAVGTLRTPGGGDIATPRWETFSLERHPDCRNHDQERHVAKGGDRNGRP